MQDRNIVLYILISLSFWTKDKLIKDFDLNSSKYSQNLIHSSFPCEHNFDLLLSVPVTYQMIQTNSLFYTSTLTQ